MNVWRKAVFVLLMAVPGLVVPAVPAAAAIDPPTCSTRQVDAHSIEGSCVNGSRIWGYRVEIYCTYEPTGGLPEYTLWSQWRVTTEPILFSCYRDASWGYYAGGSGTQIRFQAPVKG